MTDDNVQHSMKQQIKHLEERICLLEYKLKHRKYQGMLKPFMLCLGAGMGTFGFVSYFNIAHSSSAIQKLFLLLFIMIGGIVLSYFLPFVRKKKT